MSHQIWICVNENHLDEFIKEIKKDFGDKFKIHNFGNGLIVLETNKLSLFKKGVFKYYLEKYYGQNGKIKWINYKVNESIISWLQ